MLGVWKNGFLGLWVRWSLRVNVGFEGLRKKDGFLGEFGDEDNLIVKVRVVGIERNLGEDIIGDITLNTSRKWSLS